MAKAIDAIENALRDCALGYPETHEDFPWGHTAIKVKGKMFVVLSQDDDGTLNMSVKLPQSRDMAHDLPFAEPTGYGMGKHGWVTVHIRRKSDAPLPLLLAWIDESYRAVAPKKIVKELGAHAAPGKRAAERTRRSETR